MEIERKRGRPHKEKKRTVKKREKEEEDCDGRWEFGGGDDEGWDDAILRQRRSSSRASLPDSHSQQDIPCSERVVEDDETFEEEIVVDDEHLLELETVITTNDHKSSKKDEDRTQPDSRLVNVEGYEVETVWEPLLRAILSKYGDIAKNSTFSMGSRSCLLELVCSIYKRLEHSQFVNLTSLELKSLCGQIEDLELVNVEIGWLKERLNQICTAKKIYEGVSAPEDVETRTLLVVDEKKRTVETYDNEVEACFDKMNGLGDRLCQEKEELAKNFAVVEHINIFYKNYLVHGLV